MRGLTLLAEVTASHFTAGVAKIKKIVAFYDQWRNRGGRSAFSDV
jgi:hypothetical protein